MAKKTSFLRLKGFTLVELSIVLIIIGFVLAGIAAGSALVKQAGLDKVITEKNKLYLAYNNFRLTYNNLPGDMNNALSFWPTCPDSVSLPCNGNGDGKVDWVEESVAVWQHLNLSGIYSNTVVQGLELPTSYQGKSVWRFDPKPDNLTYLSMVGFYGPFISADDAYAVDSKFDDGLPLTGKITAMEGLVTDGCYEDPGTGIFRYKTTGNQGAENCVKIYFTLEEK